MRSRRPETLSVINKTAGATLVELVITIVIISVAIAGVVGAFSLIAGRSADPLSQTRAVALAQLYMDEILSRKYDDDTPPGGRPKRDGCSIDTEESDRKDYDDVDDYNAINNASPENADGESLGPAYSSFTVSVTVTCAGGEVDLSDDEAKRIDITITDPSSQDYLFTAYRANF
ncbi:type II secretion system protein [Marinobacter sp. ATCH36]|uniref:type IV pilus modification PilV family protein n=1 Tax=Marinobacter sp. ATCH36 TaxID=2945106 RepID=UPI00201FBEBE|nr:type II secretion system protein [Marinobacter sp. ATCH36]MCL7945987.1 type II secretion system GspH family protein [Marinobacter sp. ATCH36]